jgi:hypothetical protein
VDEPWCLISNAAPTLDLVWSYAERFCCEQLFRDQKSGLFQLECSGLRNPERIEGLRRQVDPLWRRGMSFVRIGLTALQQFVANATATTQAWLPIPLQQMISFWLPWSPRGVSIRAGTAAAWPSSVAPPKTGVAPRCDGPEPGRAAHAGGPGSAKDPQTKSCDWRW